MKEWTPALGLGVVERTISSSTAYYDKSYHGEGPRGAGYSAAFFGAVEFRTRSARVVPLDTPGGLENDGPIPGAVLIWRGVTFIERDGFWWQLGKPLPEPIPPGDPDEVLDMVSAVRVGELLRPGTDSETLKTGPEYRVLIDLSQAVARSPHQSGGVAGSIRRCISADVLPARVSLDCELRLAGFVYSDPVSKATVTYTYGRYGEPVRIAPPNPEVVGGGLWRALVSGLRRQRRDGKRG